MKITCYIPGCGAETSWSFVNYLLACVFTLSTQPYVCPDHYDLFDQDQDQDAEGGECSS